MTYFKIEQNVVTLFRFQICHKLTFEHSAILHDAPLHPASHSHKSGDKHLPLPLQSSGHMGTLQPAPFQPVIEQAQRFGAMQVPRLLQSLILVHKGTEQSCG
jgi:hypothetical protein